MGIPALGGNTTMNLEEALKLYDKAKEQGLVGEWPKALIVVVEELKDMWQDWDNTMSFPDGSSELHARNKL
jgi:hypothetical protein